MKYWGLTHALMNCVLGHKIGHEEYFIKWGLPRYGKIVNLEFICPRILV